MTLDKITDELWQEDLDIRSCSPRSAFAGLARPGMEERKWGRIINVLNLGAEGAAVRRAYRGFRVPPVWH